MPLELLQGHLLYKIDTELGLNVKRSVETQPYFGYVSTPSLKSTLIINELYFSPWPRPDGSLITRFSRPGGTNFTHDRPCSVCRATLFTCPLSSIFTLMAYCSTSPSHGPSSGRWTEDIELGRKLRNMQSIFCIMKNILNFAIGTQFK